MRELAERELTVVATMQTGRSRSFFSRNQAVESEAVGPPSSQDSPGFELTVVAPGS